MKEGLKSFLKDTKNTVSIELKVRFSIFHEIYVEGGIMYREWCPGAQRVFLFGEFSKLHFGHIFLILFR